MLSSRNGNLFYKYNGFFKGMVENNHIIKVDLAHAKRIRIPYTQKLPSYTSWVYVAR